MNINQTLQAPVHSLYSKPETALATISHEFTQETDKTDNDSVAKKDTSNIWMNLSEKYDVTNMTFDQLKEISTALHEAGEISLFEHAMLTFDFNRASNSIKQDIPDAPQTFTMYATEANQFNERNWIEEFQQRADKASKHGNLMGHQSHLNIVSILQKLAR